MRTVFGKGRIFTGRKFLETGVNLVVENGVVSSFESQEHTRASDEIIDLKGNLVAPGFFDIQVNGGGGVLFNDAPTVETIRTIGQAHRQFGTCGFLPTLISDDLEVVKQAIKAVDQAIEAGVPGVLGIHIEGPFLNTDRKGVHDSNKFLRLDEEHVSLLSSLKNGKTLVTLAPENTTHDLITKLVKNGVTVSAGHSNACYDRMFDALEAGVTGFTHLFNAMSQFINREPGVVGAALENQESWCGIIVDGHHVSDTALKIAMRCKPENKFILVTDAMPTVGSPTDNFKLQTKKITVRNGVCVDEQGTLAGSDLNMAAAVHNTVNRLDVKLTAALNMASLYPAEFLGLDHKIGEISPGNPATFVVLDKDCTVLNSWIDGISNKDNSGLQEA